MQESNSRTVLRQKELNEVLNRSNAVRALVASLIFSVLTLVYLLIIQFTNMYKDASQGVKVFLAVNELIQLLAAGVGYVMIRNNETDRFKAYSVGYFGYTLIVLMVLGGIDCSITGSILFFGISAGVLSMGPVFNKKIRLGFSIALTIACIIALVAGKAPSRAVVDGMLIMVASAAVGTIVQNRIIEFERMNIKLRAKTITSELDPLTGLSNRRGLDKKASVLWPYCSRTETMLGAIEIDVDFFKRYNDKFGHPAGDSCLKKIAKAIKMSAQRGSDITARTGGEEFMVFVQGLDERAMVELAIKIRNNINALSIPHAYVNVSNYVTVSMGIATIIPDEENSFDDLYEMADKALYAAKDNGRNCIVYNNRIYGRMKNGMATVISG